MARRVVDVLVPVALERAYSYRVPEDMEIAPGDVVAVPLGTREVMGVVWAENPTPNPRLDNRLKEISGKIEVPPLREELRSFVDWTSDYTLGARGMVMRMCLRMGENLGTERVRVGVRLVGQPKRMTAARSRVLAVLADGLLRHKREAAEEAGVSVGVIDGLVDDGTLAVEVMAAEPIARPPDPNVRRRRNCRKVNAPQATRCATSVIAGRIFRDLARRCNGLRQDRGLFRGCGRKYPAWKTVADPDAGDRADRTIPRSFR